MSSIHFQLKHTLLAVISSLALSLFPLLFFFNFLYYTDVGSTLTVLLGYLMSRQDRHLLASLVSHVTHVVAMVMRIISSHWVWAFSFVRLILCGQCLWAEPRYWDIWSQNYQRAKVSILICPWKRCSLHIDSLSLFHQFFLLLRSALCNLPTILSWAWSYLLLGIGFIIFIISNDGIVLGDKTHHTVSVHIPQVLYYSW